MKKTSNQDFIELYRTWKVSGIGFKNIYGVNLQQSWKSSSYSDLGYIFLMVDFENENKPVIHVRSWQPQKGTEQKDVIELGDFDIIK